MNDKNNENNSVITFTDSNGKTFNLNFNAITDINGDATSNSSISDSIKNRVTKLHDVEYFDENGNAIDSVQLLKDMQSGKTKVVALDVEMEATHSGPNHNYCIYYEDSMEKDAESFMNPFRKPVLKNHNSYSGEPLGRIIQSWHGPSALTDDRSAIHLKCRITDVDAIPKFIDGRYGTVSIGGSMNTVTCNICGKTILKDGKFKFCGHWRGETYKDQVCYWGAKDIEYHEVSTVNTPADDFAQVMKVTVVTDENKNKGEDSSMGNNNPTNDSNTNTTNMTVDNIKKSVCDMIDGLLGDNNNPTTNSNIPNGNNGETSTSANDSSNGNENSSTTTTTQDNNNELEKTKKDLEGANSKITELEAKLKDATNNLNAKTKECEDCMSELQTTKDMCYKLATANKEMVVDNIIEKEKIAGKLTDDKTEDRKKELIAMSMKELNSLHSSQTSDSNSNNQQRPLANVTNPTLANNNDNKPKNKNTVENNDDKQTSDNNVTIDDFANSIVGKLFK